MTCNHTAFQTRTYEDVYAWEEADRWVTETVEVYTTEDIDTHRYRCTQCGKVMYYSGAARDYYEGKGDPKGLFP